MIFNTLKIKNIRSYEKATIDFPGGTSLFEGDVGSGKSTILMAIEFALFGLGNQKGDALLRKGAEKGSVLLKFSVGEGDYQVKRVLVKGKNNSIKQDKAILGINGKRIQLSASEIKERILDILNFKEPASPNAQSVIFRYAVYTPQEEMKFILSQKPDTRLQILRKAFGIEDYKTAAENATLISKAVREKTKYLDGKTSDLEEKKNSLKELNENLTRNKRDLSVFINRRDELYSNLQGRKVEIDKLKNTESELKQVQAQIPHLESQLEGKKELISGYNQQISTLESENRDELTPKILNLEKLEKPTNIGKDELKDKIRQIRGSIENRRVLQSELKVYQKRKQGILEKLEDWKDKDPEELSNEIETLTQTLKEHEDTLVEHQGELSNISDRLSQLKALKKDMEDKLENLDGLGDVCPICGSKLDEAHKKDVKQEREKKIRGFNSEIMVLKMNVKSKCEKQIEQDQGDIKQIEREIQECQSLRDRFKDLSDVEEEISTVEGKISNINEKISLNIREDTKFETFEEYITQLEELLGRLEEYEQAQEGLVYFKDQFNKNNETIERNKGKIETLDGEIKELNGTSSDFQNRVKDLPELAGAIGELQEVYAKTDKEYGLANNQVIATQTSIESLGTRILGLEEEVKEKEQSLKQLDKLKDYNNWLTDYLIPTLGVIEKHVMQNIYLEFDENFKKWFNLLIDDPSKTGKIDEEFTPIIEQDGFGQEINYLSGGEKTSVALSYRLALNNIVQKVSTGMKSNLLIMDEPTDGFSKEQLYKIRDILQELNYPQIIIVSHEKELESFADSVFQIVKVDGVSEVSQLN